MDGRTQCHGGVRACTLSLATLLPRAQVVDAVGLSLTGANLFGYMKCSSDAQVRCACGGRGTSDARARSPPPHPPAQSRIQSALTGGAIASLSMIPGGLPTLGTTLMSMMAAGATASAGAAAAASSAPRPASATRSAAAGATASRTDDPHNPFGPGTVTV